MGIVANPATGEVNGVAGKEGEEAPRFSPQRVAKETGLCTVYCPIEGDCAYCFGRDKI